MSVEASHPFIHEQEFASPEGLRDRLESHHLENGDSITLAADAFTQYEPGEIGLPRTGYYSVVGEVRMGTDYQTTAVVVRERRDQKDSYQLYGLTQDKKGRAKVGPVVSLDQNRPLIVGRLGVFDQGEAEPSGQLWPEADDKVSRQHFRISLSGDKIAITDLSMNGSEVVGHKLDEGYRKYAESDDYRAEHTTNAAELAERSGFLIQDGKEKIIEGRVVITRDTQFDGSKPAIDIRPWVAGGESIVVDSQKYPEEFTELQQSYEEMLADNLKGKRRKPTEEDKLQAIFDTVSNAMEYDLEYVAKLESRAARVSGSNGLRKVALNTYLRDGKGVCRQMALTAAWLGGELARNGQLSGKATAEVNQRMRDNSAHEWMRYTAADGTVYIIDPAQKHFGKLTDFLNDKEVWDYFRPGERQRYQLMRGDSVSADKAVFSERWKAFRGRQ